jgi:hypothetical protein
VSKRQLGIDLCEILVDKVAPGQVSSQVRRVSPISIIPSTILTHIHPHVALARRAQPGNLPKCSYISEIGKHWLKKVLSLNR